MAILFRYWNTTTSLASKFFFFNITFKNYFLLYKKKNQLYAMAKTNDFQICQQYLDNYINTMKKEIDTCHNQLNNQAQSYPLTALSLDQLDYYLKKFVDGQRKYLLVRNNRQLQRFTDDFHEKQLLETISTYRLNSIDQVCLTIS